MMFICWKNRWEDYNYKWPVDESGRFRYFVVDTGFGFWQKNMQSGLPCSGAKFMYCIRCHKCWKSYRYNENEDCAPHGASENSLSHSNGLQQAQPRPRSHRTTSSAAQALISLKLTMPLTISIPTATSKTRLCMTWMLMTIKRSTLHEQLVANKNVARQEK